MYCMCYSFKTLQLLISDAVYRFSLRYMLSMCCIIHLNQVIFIIQFSYSIFSYNFTYIHLERALYGGRKSQEIDDDGPTCNLTTVINSG